MSLKSEMMSAKLAHRIACERTKASIERAINTAANSGWYSTSILIDTNMAEVFGEELRSNGYNVIVRYPETVDLADMRITW